MTVGVGAATRGEPVSLRDLPVVGTFSRNELGALLGLGGLPVEARSPLQVLLSGGETGAADADIRDLIRAGWVEAGPPLALRGDLADALSILAAPSARIRVVLGSAEGLTRMALFSGREDPRKVRFESERSGMWARVEFFAEHDPLLERVGRGLDLSAGFLRPRFQVTWPWPWFIVLMALLDTYRATCLGAILERCDPPEPALDVDSVLEALEAGLRHVHYYWAVSVSATVAPVPLDINRAGVETVLQEMVAAGVLRESSHGVYRYGPSVQEFAASLLLMPAFLGLSRHRPGFPELGWHVVALRGANSLWRITFEPAPGGPWRVRVEAVDGESLLVTLREALTNELPPAPAEALSEAVPLPVLPSPASTQVSCSSCGRFTRRGRFCTGCGARLAP